MPLAHQSPLPIYVHHDKHIEMHVPFQFEFLQATTISDKLFRNWKYLNEANVNENKGNNNANQMQTILRVIFSGFLIKNNLQSMRFHQNFTNFLKQHQNIYSPTYVVHGTFLFAGRFKQVQIRDVNFMESHDADVLESIH